MNASFAALFFALCIVLLSGKALGQNQQEMNRQSLAAFEKSDAVLNRIYSKVLRSIDSESRPALRKAQQTWIAFRDAEASLEGDFVARGGSMRPMIVHGRAKELTDNRIKELQRIAKEYGS